MKTFVKIALIAAITALVTLSCEPGLSPNNEWWGEYNKQFDGSTYISAADSSPGVSISSSLVYGVDKDNIVTITFPDDADVLKQDNPETELEKFLSFWTFNPTLTVEPGNATVLDELTGWTLQRRVGNKLYIDLKTTFTSTSYYSGVVVKIDGTKYTYSNGKKIDVDRNGIPGEAGYDDYYSDCQNVTGTTPSTGNFIKPGNQGWEVNISNNFSISPGNNDTYTVGLVQLTSNPDNIIVGNTPGLITQADKDSVLTAIAEGFKVEKFFDGKWSEYTTAVFNVTEHKIMANLSYSHMTAYRIVFEKDNISLETEKEFFGVKQRIRITGGGETIYNIRRNITRLEGDPELYYNSTKRSFKDFPTDNISIYSNDRLGKNVVLKLIMPNSSAESISSSTTKYYFKTVDLDIFKENFKIYESSSYPAVASPDRREIGITAVEFKRENPVSDTNGENVIYITLDPAYKSNDKNKSFYIGDGIGYESGISVFSSKEIWKNKGFKAYNLNNAF